MPAVTARNGGSLDVCQANDTWTTAVRPHSLSSLTHASSEAEPLAAISKGMRAVKLYSNKIIQFLTGVTDVLYDNH